MPEANQCRRPVLAGWNFTIRDPERCMCSSGKTKQETNEAHSIYGQNLGERMLESWNCFLRSVKPAYFPPKVIRCSAWLRRLLRRCLNRLRTGFTCSKEQSQRWRYYEGDTTCECRLATGNTEHMMQYTLLAQPCSLDDLNKFNETAKKCVERWKTLV